MSLHPRNKHQGKYDFKILTEANPALKPFVGPNKFGETSIDFANAEAVKALNKALLTAHYGIKNWDIPANYLVPPIPGRADYIHAIADLIGVKKGPDVKVFDIGTGSSLIYPIIGNTEYKWSFVASDIDPFSINSAQNILDQNNSLSNIEIRLQEKTNDIFFGIIKRTEKFAVSICNPPFHESLEEAQKGTLRKIRNLNKGKKTNKVQLNFGGQNNELWIEGGEKAFIINMIRQSKFYGDNFDWFTTLVSKASNLPALESSLKQYKAAEVKIIPLGHGNKVSRILAWRFNPENHNIVFEK